MRTKPHHAIVGIITMGGASGNAWESALADQLSAEVEVVLIESQELMAHAHILKAGLCIARSATNDVTRKLAEIGAEVILLGDTSDHSMSAHWILLHCASSPLNVAKVASLFLRNRSLSEEQSLPKTKIDLVTYSHGCSLWESIQRFSGSLADLKTLPQRLQASARLLDDSLYGARVRQIGVRQEDGEYAVLNHSGQSSYSARVKRDFITQLQSANVVVDVSAGGELRSQLIRHDSELIVSVRGKDTLIGWFLVAVDDYHHVFLNKPLAEKIARHLGVLLTEQEQIFELASFKHAVHEGLDQVETGISILDKAGRALVENKAAREVSRKLGCPSAHLIPEVHRAIQKAKFGYPTDTFLHEYAVRTSAWGNLNNGCVLQTRTRIASEDSHFTTLNAWGRECLTMTKSLGLELTLTVEQGQEVEFTVPESLSIEAICRFLLQGEVSKKIILSHETTTQVLRLHFDQEYLEGSNLQSQPMQSPPSGVDVSYASLGRRAAIEVPLRKPSRSLTPYGTA